MIGLIICTPPGVVRAVEQLDIEIRSNTVPLPYSSEIIQGTDWETHKVPVVNEVQIIKPQYGSGDTAWFIHGFNPDKNSDGPAVLSFENFTSGQIINWTPLYFTLTGFILYDAADTKIQGVVAGGHRNDSAFAAIMTPGNDIVDYAFLTTGDDLTGNGKWECDVAPVLCEDYDYDGHDEVFLWVDPGRNLYPRLLICLEPDNRSIEWSVPVAGAVMRGNLFSCRDSANPAVVFSTYNYKNGVADNNFDDYFCWLGRINSRGEVTHRYIVAEEHGSAGLWPGEKDGLFYAFYSLPFVKPEDSARLLQPKYQFAKVDSEFRPVAFYDCDDRIFDFWMDYYPPAGDSCIFTVSRQGKIRIFDRQLNVLAKSAPSALRAHFGTFLLPGRDEPAYLFESGDRLIFYSRDFDQLGSIDEKYETVSGLVYDDNGCVTHLSVTRLNAAQILKLNRMGVLEFIRLIYWHYQVPFLIILLLLILALVIVNAVRQRAARRLAQSERKLHQFFQVSRDGFYRCDMEGRLIWVSPAALRILGYDSMDEVVGTQVADYYVNPEDRRYLMEKIREIGHVDDFEITMRKKDGSQVTISTSTNIYRDESGEISGVEGVIRDVTERKLAEQALIESEERYRSLIESAGEAIFSLNRQGEFLFMNSIAAERLGGKPSDFIGKTMWDLFPKDIADIQMEDILEVIDNGRGLVRESETILKGISRVYITSIEPVRDSTGVIVAATAYARDITELMQTRRELKSERDFVRSLLDTANSLIVCLDHEAKITVFNKGCEHTTGYSRKEVIGKSWPEMFLPEEERHPEQDNFVEWVRKNPHDTYEGTIITKKGDRRTILWSNSVISGSGSEQFVAIAVGQDITEMKLARKRLAESERRYSSLVESADIGIVVIDPTSRKLLYVNKEMCRSLGYSQDELLKMKIENLHPSEALKDAYRAMDDISSGKIRMFEELPFRHKDGSLRYFNVTGGIQNLGDQKAVVGYFRDVTDRRKERLALKESEDLSRAVIEHSPIGVTVRNRKGKLLIYNSAWRNIWNISDDQLKDYTTRERNELRFDQRDDYLGPWKNSVKKIYEEGGYLHIPEIEVSASDTYGNLWLSHHFYALRDANGKVDRVVVLTEDISDRKKAELEIQRGREQSRAQYQGIPVPTYTWQMHDEELILIDYNDAAYEITKGGIAELIGITLTGLYGEEEEIVQDIHRCFNERTTFSREMDYEFRTTGEKRILNVSYVYVPPDLVVVHTDDVTDRRRAEEGLKESEERFRTIAQATPISIAVFEAKNNTIVYANRALSDLLGYRPDELHGMNAGELYFNPDDRNLILALLDENGTVDNYEIRAKKSDGGIVWGLLSIRPITFDGKPSLFATFVDITDRRAAQQKLREAEEARYNQVRQIAGGVSHEIYNSLFPATSSLAKLNDRLGKTSPEELERNRKLLKLAEAAVGRAIDLTDLVTKYSRLDRERKIEQVRLRPLLEEIIEAQADKIGNLEVSLELSFDKEISVCGRSDHLHSLFSNLILNALDALEEVTTDRHIRISAVEEPGNVVRIRFADSGPGINEEQRSKIFEPFFSTKPTRGTGLGLAIAKRVVQMYNGSIELEREVDKGAVFVIFLKSGWTDPPPADN